MPRTPKPATPALTTQRVAAYCRVSSDDQAERQTIASQVDFLRRYVDLHQLDAADFYVDDGVSGTLPLDERPEGRRLLEDARAHRFGAVLVYRLDRLGRSLRALLEAHDDLERVTVSIRSATEPFDTATPIGQFLFQLLGSLAELERSTIAERTTMGRNRVARAGKWTNGHVPFGYDLDADGCLVPSARVLPHGETEADVLRGIFDRVAAGATVDSERARLEALGVPALRRLPKRPDTVKTRWSVGRLHKTLRNSIYRGEYTLNSQAGPVPVPVPALVTDEVWSTARAAMTRNRDLSKRGTDHEYLLRGLLRCHTLIGDRICGRAYIGGPMGSRRRQEEERLPYYRCGAVAAQYRTPDRPRCPSKVVRMDDLDRRIWADVRAVILYPDAHLAEAQAQIDRQGGRSVVAQERRRQVTAALAAKAAERERAQTLFRLGLADLAETERALTAIRTETERDAALLSALDADWAALDATEQHLTSARLAIEQLVPLVAAGDAGDREAQRHAIEAVVQEIGLVTTFVPPPTARHRGPQKRLRAVIHYRWQWYGGFNRDQSELKPPYTSLTIDHELDVPREYRYRD